MSAPPTTQPMIDPVVRRHTSACGEDSPRRACAGPRRSAMKLSPMSRADCSSVATTASTRPKPTASTTGHTRSLVEGRVCSAQPKGESHTSHELSIRVRSSLGVPAALPRPRIRNVATRIQTVSALRAAGRAHQLRGEEPDAEEGHPVAPAAAPASQGAARIEPGRDEGER